MDAYRKKRLKARQRLELAQASKIETDILAAELNLSEIERNLEDTRAKLKNEKLATKTERMEINKCSDPAVLLALGESGAELALMRQAYALVKTSEKNVRLATKKLDEAPGSEKAKEEFASSEKKLFLAAEAYVRSTEVYDIALANFFFRKKRQN